MEEIHKTLQELRLALDKAHFDHSTDEGVGEKMLLLEEKLREESLMSGDEYIVNELKEALQHFEETHPQITDVLGRLSDLLAKMGV